MTTWYEQAISYPLEAIAKALGMKPHRSKGRWGPCPSCGAEKETDKKGKSLTRPPLKFYKNSKGANVWLCNNHGCNAYGNIFDLVAYKKEGQPTENVGWKRIRELFETLEICERTVENFMEKKDIEYPPVEEIFAMLKASTPIPKSSSPMISRWCKTRGLDKTKVQAGLIDRNFDCSSLTQKTWHDKTLPWWLDKWKKQFPILIPLVDYKGDLKSLIGRATNADKRKQSCPLGYSTAELFFANKNARLFLKKEKRPEKIWICEGEVDYLTLAQFDQLTVIGIRSGSLSHLQLMPWHICQKVYVATDNDQQGDNFANQIKKLVQPAQPERVDVRKLGGKQ